MRLTNRYTVLFVSLGLLSAAVMPVSGAASDTYLWIKLNDIPKDESNPTPSPKISVSGRADCCVPEYDASAGQWRLKLSLDQKELITPYVVSLDSPHIDVVAITLDFPSSLERQNQSLVLQPPRPSDASEGTVRDIWSNHTIFIDRTKIDVQLAYLQDLYFIVNQQRIADSTNKLSAARLRAAYLLLAVVSHLGEQTWYIVHNRYQTVINFAKRILERAAADKDRACRWLGKPSCAGIPDRLAALERLSGNRLARIYELVIPSRAKLNSSFCDARRLTNLKNYYDYFSSTINNNNAKNMRSGVSEIRVAMDIAQCSVARVTCSENRLDAAEAEKELKEALTRLEHAMTVYRDAEALSLASLRVREVAHLRKAIATGQPANCTQK